MKAAVDSSVVVSALCASDADHEACRRLLLTGRHGILAHALTETFSMLTGGRLGFRIPASVAAMLLRERILPKLHSIALDAEEILTACDEAEARGIRGDAIYDYLHLVAARKAAAKKFYTLNLTDFHSFHRSGDPEILAPY